MTGPPAGGTLPQMSKSSKSLGSDEISISKVESAEPKVSTSTRNLSLERMVAYLEKQKRDKCDEVLEMDVTTAGVPLKNADGSLKMKDGVPVIEKRPVLKRTLIEMEYDSRIERVQRNVARQMNG